jgi:hypothetical protein
LARSQSVVRTDLPRRSPRGIWLLHESLDPRTVIYLPSLIDWKSITVPPRLILAAQIYQWRAPTTCFGDFHEVVRSDLPRRLPRDIVSG